MALLKIRLYGDPVLRKVAEPIREITPEIRQLAENMINTMYENDGVGLAAPQIGESIRLFVMDSREDDSVGPIVCINPVIRNPQGAVVMEEGCLSIPGIRADVKRAESFDFEATGLDGKPFSFRAEGLLARIILHENDHLDGKMFVDYLSPVRKMMIKDALRQLEREAQKEFANV